MTASVIKNLGAFMKLCIILLFTLIFSYTFAQDEYQKDFQEIKSRYNYQIYRPSVVGFNYFIDYSGADLNQDFHLAVNIQNDFLQFNKEDNKFISRYEVSLIIRQDEETWFSKSWQRDAELQDFERTNSKRDYQYQVFSVNFVDEGVENLQNGEYEIRLEVNDKLSSRQYKNKRILKYSNPSDSSGIFHTEIAFSPQTQIDSLNTYPITATKNVIDINRPYIAFANVFTSPKAKMDVNVRLYKKDKDQNSLLAQDNSEPTGDENGKYLINWAIPFKTMDEGKYSIRFSVSIGDSTYEIERDFSVLWFLKPLYLYKVDLAVRPMKYLLSPEQMEKVKDFDTDELTKWFNNFWKERDPNKETVFNELQNEYFNRVTEAVRSYSNRFKEGWQTDMGMVFLLYGEPNEVDNRSYSVTTSPHIIWNYNYDNNVRQFIFVDKTKTGDFVLVEKKDEQGNEQ